MIGITGTPTFDMKINGYHEYFKPTEAEEGGSLICKQRIDLE